MVSCGTLLKSALVAVVLVAVVECGPGEKLATCCKTVNKQEITEEITGYLVQKASSKCVRAVIFQTSTGLFCSQLTAPWVRRKIAALEEAKRQAASSVVPSSSVSLLSIITSTASPASSSSSRPAVPSTSDTPAGETFSETADE